MASQPWLLRGLRVLALSVALPALPVPAAAQWNPLGAPVCGNPCAAGNHLVTPDGDGGIYVTWTDRRDPTGTDDDVYAQRLTALGVPAAGWPATGLPICVLPKSQVPTSIAPDGQGGAIAVWYDLRHEAEVDLYAQRVMGDGSIAPGWPLNGAPVTRAPGGQSFGFMTPDGTGGAFVAWDDGVDVYAQHLSPDGSVASGWPVDGLPICIEAGFQSATGIVADGLGGAVIVWGDGRRLPLAADTYAQRILSDGSIAPGWTPGGIPILLDRGFSKAAPDGAGGFYAACGSVVPQGIRDYVVQRFTFAGTVAPGWPDSGIVVCDASNVREGLVVSPDGLGGLLLAWYDYRPSQAGYSEIYAARVLPDGSFPPGWPVNGLRISDDTTIGSEFDPAIAPNGLGGAYLTWEWPHDSEVPSYVQHVTASGAPAAGWPPHGVRVAPTNHQIDPQVVADGAGGAIVAWREAHLDGSRRGIFAQRFGVDGPTPVQVSPASVEAEPDRVVLTWRGPGIGNFVAQVYRRSDETSWLLLGAPQAGGADRLSYEDRSVNAGERYAYRLGYLEDGTEQFTAETWVDVPLRFGLSLEGFRPNPSPGTPVVAFVLPTREPATLEVLDVSGRRVLSRAVGTLGAGRHQVVLDHPRLAAGIYLIRLRHGGETRVARGLVMR